VVGKSLGSGWKRGGKTEPTAPGGERRNWSRPKRKKGKRRIGCGKSPTTKRPKSDQAGERGAWSSADYELRANKPLTGDNRDGEVIWGGDDTKGGKEGRDQSKRRLFLNSWGVTSTLESNQT